MRFLNKNINKFILLIPTLLLAKPAFADGGIPLWLNTAASMLVFSHLEGDLFRPAVVFYLISGIIALIITALVETIVIKLFFFKKEIFKKLFDMMFKANLYSTLVGIIILILPLFFGNFKYNLFNILSGPWVGICTNCSISAKYFLFFAMHFALLIESCIVEYFYAKKSLIKDFSTKKIKIAISIANITSYIGMPIAILFNLFFVGKILDFISLGKVIY